MNPEVLKNVLTVGFGSALGGIARYGIALILKNLSVAFPWGTLCVNALGCFLLGLLWGWFGRHGGADGTWALLLTVGFCGGFTTFSTFSKEALALLQGGAWAAFVLYLVGSVVAGLVLMLLAYSLTK